MKKENQDSRELLDRLEQELALAKAELQKLSSAEEKSVFPVLRISPEGFVIYANSSSYPLLLEWGVSVGGKIPASFLEANPGFLDSDQPSRFQVARMRPFSVQFLVVPVLTLGYIHYYGTSLEYSGGESAIDNVYGELFRHGPTVLVRVKKEDGFPIEFVSQNIRQFGYDEGHLIEVKQAFADMVSTQDRTKFLKELTLHGPATKPLLELRIHTIGGETRWVEIRPAHFPGSEELVSFTLLDITQRKTAELVQKNSIEELKKINSELDRFVYTASHDLKAPLRSIVGLINLAKAESVNEGLDIYLDKIFKSAGKLDNFINDLVNFSRSTRLDVKVKKIDFDQLITDTIENLKFMENASAMTIETEVNDLHFYSDENRLGILFSNMISNSMKYQKLKSIEKARLSIKIDVKPEKATLIFEDNGIGISKEAAANIYDMFYRASTQSEGSGLGLYIVKEIVKKLKGSISLQSEEGIGSKFTIQIPNESKK